MNPRLQPLRIPTGWHVTYNGLWELDPVLEMVPAKEHISLLKQDLLRLIQPRFNRQLNVGWFPEGELEHGGYKVVMYEGDFRGRLLQAYKTRDRIALVDEIERLLLLVNDRQL